MEIKEFESFAGEQSDKIAELYLHGFDLEKRILHANTKLAEEVGELSNEVLKKLKAQRAVKLNEFKSDDLADEVADVLIVTGIIAHLTGVSVEEALKKKIIKLEERWEKVKEEENV